MSNKKSAVFNVVHSQFAENHPHHGVGADLGQRYQGIL